jgi:hypothetical protein
MAGSDEQLRMIATPTDQWSPALKSMQRSLRSLSAETGDFHKTSITQSKAHAIAFNELRRSVTDVGDRVRGVFTPAL